MMEAQVPSRKIPSQSLSRKSGLILGVALIAFFLLMKVLGLAHIASLRTVNIAIVFAVLFYTIRSYRIRVNQDVVYLEGFYLGLFTSGVAAVVFGVFMYLYLLVDHQLFEQLKSNAPQMSEYFTPLLAAVIVMAEIMVAGLIFSFALMQYYKNDRKHS